MDTRMRELQRAARRGDPAARAQMGRCLRALATWETNNPGLQLVSRMSIACRDGLVSSGQFAIFEDGEYTDVGDSLDVTIHDWRPKAIDLGTGEISYDTASPLFGRAMLAKHTGSWNEMMYGIELMLLLHDHGMIVTWYLGTKSGRRVASESLGESSHFLGHRYLLGAQERGHHGFTWWQPTIVRIS